MEGTSAETPPLATVPRIGPVDWRLSGKSDSAPPTIVGGDGEGVDERRW